MVGKWNGYRSLTMEAGPSGEAAAEFPMGRTGANR